MRKGESCRFVCMLVTVAAACWAPPAAGKPTVPQEAAIPLTWVAVCGMVGEGLPRATTSWLSSLVIAEVNKADSLRAIEEMLDCSRDLGEALTLARTTPAEKLIVGRVATIADLFAIELNLFDMASGARLGREAVEVTASPLDPRLAVRVATQRLLKLGGQGTLPESHINVSSTPPAARIYIGGLLEGRAPITLSVRPGRHTIRAELPGYSAWSLDVDVKDGETLSLNAGLGGSLSATQSKSDGAKVILGFTVPYVTALGEAVLYLSNVKSARPYFGWLLIAPPASYLIAADELGNKEVDIGRAWMIVSSGLWGTAWGLLGMGTSGEDSARPYVLTSMVSSALGVVVSTNVSEAREISRKRVSFVNTGGFLGSLVGLGVPHLLDVSRPRVYNVSLLAGGIVGIAFTTSLTSNLDFMEEGEAFSRLQLQPKIWLGGYEDAVSARSLKSTEAPQPSPQISVLGGSQGWEFGRAIRWRRRPCRHAPRG